MINGKAARRTYFLRCFRIVAEGHGRRFVLSGNTGDSDLRQDEAQIDPEHFIPAMKDAAPGGDDTVCVFDFLPRFDRERLPGILQALAELPCTFFFVVPLAYSDRLLADGTNANNTVETSKWWAELLGKSFGEIDTVETHSEHDAAFMTRRLSKAEKRAIGRLSPKIFLARELDRIGSRAVILARTLTRSIESKAALLRAVAGKSVSVVGNARSLGKKRLGSRIDANDIVVRFNRAPIISREANGYRTDWLATSVPLTAELIEASVAQRLLWMSTRRSKINLSIARAPNLYLHPRQDVRSLAARASLERPTTGLMLIDLLAQSRCRSVELFGFDFYKSQSLSGHQSLDNTPHTYDREEAFVAGLVEGDTRFKICS